MYGMKPIYHREKIWGSRAYITVPPETRTGNIAPKLHAPQAWLGYFVGNESESIMHIWHPDKSRVMRVNTARVEDGVGVNDEHSEASIQQSRPREATDPADGDNEDPESSLNSDDSQDDGINHRHRARLIQQIRSLGGYVNLPSVPRGLGKWEWLQDGVDNNDAEAQGYLTQAEVSIARGGGLLLLAEDSMPVTIWWPDVEYFNPDRQPEGPGRWMFFTSEGEELAAINSSKAYGLRGSGAPTAG